MKNWNNLSSSDRIFAWREFRQSIDELPKKKKIQKIAKFFSTIPIARRYIDYYTPESWPSPWEILHHGWSCQSSISLLIAYTLQISTNVNFDLWLIDDSDDVYLVIVLEDGGVMNYELGKVININTIAKTIKVLHRYKSTVLTQYK